jgi:A/G-specific adenine glycosylase
LTDLQASLLDWYDQSKRDLPWRRRSDPYAVWVSEIMLQQTTVKAVVPFYERWMARFPTLESLAEAEESEALALWQGLGYYRRCRMLLEGARQAAQNGIPQSAEEWRKISGVGRYTAGAIASIAQGQPAALVDGNVARVYARLTADRSSGPALDRAAWAWAEENVCAERPGDWSQALMELGATVCLPKSPRCGECPWTERCEARRLEAQADIPAPKAKPDWIRLEHSVVVPWHEGRIGLRRTPEGGWWQGMWEAPRAPSAEPDELVARLLAEPHLRAAKGFSHVVTRHKIRVAVWLAALEEPWPELDWVSGEEAAGRAMPAPAQRAVKAALELLGPLPGFGG